MWSDAPRLLPSLPGLWPQHWAAALQPFHPGCGGPRSLKHKFSGLRVGRSHFVTEAGRGCEPCALSIPTYVWGPWWDLFECGACLSAESSPRKPSSP